MQFDTFTMAHIGVELLVVGGMFFYLNKNISFVHQEHDKLIEKINVLEKRLNEIAYYLTNRGQSHPKASPRRETIDSFEQKKEATSTDCGSTRVCKIPKGKEHVPVEPEQPASEESETEDEDYNVQDIIKKDTN